MPVIYFPEVFVGLQSEGQLSGFIGDDSQSDRIEFVAFQSRRMRLYQTTLGRQNFMKCTIRAHAILLTQMPRGVSVEYDVERAAEH